MTGPKRKGATKKYKEDISEFLEQQSENKYVQQLLHDASEESLNFQEIVAFGLNHLSDGDDDFALADYFHALSEFRELPATVRSFLMDVMIYCEDKCIDFKNTTAIRDCYSKKIEPLIRADE